MIIATLELPDKKKAQINELVNGDIEIIVSEQVSYWGNKQLARFTIPQDRRELLSNYLWQH